MLSSENSGCDITLCSVSVLLDPVIALLYDVLEGGKTWIGRGVVILIREVLERAEVHVGAVQDVLTINTERTIIGGSNAIEILLSASS